MIDSPERYADLAAALSRTPREIPCKYLYDALGSHLFEAICELPWYRVTHAETSLLRRYGTQMVAPFARPLSLVELGGGSGEKMALLAAAAGTDPLEAHLVDISATAIDLARRTLAPLSHVTVTAHTATYDAGLGEIARARRSEGALLVLFLGSNIGNFAHDEALAFVRRLRAQLAPGDGLLLGADLVKPEADLIYAYDDPLGVTAAFNKNLLIRLNRELGADFALQQFAHRVVWDPARSRIEMHLESRVDQRVRVPFLGLTLDLARGERIWTESSYKYTPASIRALGEEAGLAAEGQWIEPDAGFASTLFRVS